MEDTLLNQIISELNAELKSKYSDFKGIYLFGSRARGDAHKDSDYDFVLLFDRTIDCKFEDSITAVILEFEIKYDIVIDFHAYNLEDIINPITPFRFNIKTEGIYYGAI
jgi:uncharacterized protein